MRTDELKQRQWFSAKCTGVHLPGTTCSFLVQFVPVIIPMMYVSLSFALIVCALLCSTSDGLLSWNNRFSRPSNIKPNSKALSLRLPSQIMQVYGKNDNFRKDKGTETSLHMVLPTDLSLEPVEALVPPNHEDMQRFAYILANMTDHLDAQPEVALTIASQEMGWLYSKDVPK